MSIGATTASTGAFTTLSASSTVTLSGGTANGVAYLNGSKVLTTGSALTFDGTNLGVGTSTYNGRLTVKNPTVSGNQVIFAIQAATSTSQLASWDLNQTTDVSTFGTDYGAPLAFKVNSTETMRLTSTSLYTASTINVGIGTSSPSEKLDVRGSDPVALVRATNTSGTATLSLYGVGSNGSDLAVTQIKGVPEGAGTAASLTFSTRNSGATTAERMRLDSSGNLGLGVTPSAWKSSYRALAVANADIASATSIGLASFSANAYLNASDQWIYKITDGASRYQQYAGIHSWYTAASGTAGNTITFTQAMTLDASGQLGLGTTTPTDTNGYTRALDIRGTSTSNGGAVYTSNSDATVRGFYGTFGASGSGSVNFGSTTSTELRFYVANSQKVTIDTSGNVGIGVSTIATPSASRRGMQISNGTSGSVIFLSNFATEGDNPRIFSSITSQYDLGLVAGGSTGFINFYTNGTERMSIAAAGAVNVVGALSKGSGSFKIDHPLKPETHHLIHSFIEGPQADLIYRGKVNLVNGTATVNIDTASTMTEGTFVALCRDVQCFTTNESDWTAVRGSVVDNILSIQAQDSTSTASVSWMVIGERQDQHMYDTDWTDDNGKVIVEPLKEQSSTALEGA
jgi:hypothetical protein